MESRKHAKLAPSGADRWLACPGSVDLTSAIPDTGSDYAEEGTLAHALAAYVLTYGGTVADAAKLADFGAVDEEMIGHMEGYVAEVAALRAGVFCEIEVSLPLDEITGEEGAAGTADVVILDDDGELQVRDLKYGAGVPVSVDDSAQLRVYALAALRKYSPAADIKRVRLAIHQPRNGGTTEHVVSVTELNAFGTYVRKMAKLALAGGAELVPGEKQCRWCSAKAVCPALREHVLTQFSNKPQEPVSLEQLNASMCQVKLVEDWCLAVRAEVEKRLLAGVTFPDWKLVTGKKGNRAWIDEKEADAALSVLLPFEEAHKVTVITPTAAEKKVGKAAWESFKDLVTQADGRPSVASMLDERPAISPAAKPEDFSTQEV
jgi:hypothetical protein